MAKASYIGDLSVELEGCTCEEEKVEAVIRQIQDEYQLSYEDGLGFCFTILRKRKDFWDVSIYEVEVE